MEIERRIEKYWDERSENFSEVRRRELAGADAEGWLEYIESKLPSRAPLRILDVGTGAGFFALLMARRGHEVIGVDMSREMIKRARLNADDLKLRAEFRLMNAQRLDFDDETFDAVLSRNLTWTLPDVERAYRDWHRVLKVGGVMLNFDSDYGDKDFGDVVTCSRSGVDNDQLDECGAIKNALAISRCRRPSWDEKFLSGIGFDVSIDEDIAPSVHRDNTLDFDRIALFAITAVKK
ncbi:MAG: class I SAM-dependent methyltransferase [Selenomonadaceae bacterium]|nr:class I SAM-dependent methyltransferase [Selenomonadaceae bacterium]